MNDAPSTGPGYREVAYDREEHGARCVCGVDLTTLDHGEPAISVWVDDEERLAHSDEPCAIATVAEQRYERRIADEEDGHDGRHERLKEVG